MVDQNKSAALVRAAIGLKFETQTRLSKAVGVDRKIFNYWLHRKCDLPIETIQRIFRELGLDKKAVLLSVDAGAIYKKGDYGNSNSV